jgi:glucosamine-6-phosphate deaminase
MHFKILANSEELGKEAAKAAAEVLNHAIAEHGKARLVLSTGASQFDTLKALVGMKIDWSRVEMFHLDEYVALPESHPASFRKYLKERFINLVHPGKVFLVDGEGDYQAHIAELSEEIQREPVDLAIVGIGENAHIAFNDPPADFETKAAYHIVTLDDNCKKQQVREGWFPDISAVPKEAISMTVHQILASKTIISPVPHAVKAQAIKAMFDHEVTPEIPATILKEHPNFLLLLDKNSAEMIKK